MKIGQAIKTLRLEKAKLNQKEFAEKIGINQAYLSGIETGSKKPSTELLETMADYFKCPIQALLWFSIEEEDVQPEKVSDFRFLKPHVDEFVKALI